MFFVNLYVDEVGILVLDDYVGVDGEVEGLVVFVVLVEFGVVFEGVFVVDIDGVICCG